MPVNQAIRPISHPSTNDKVFALVAGLLRATVASSYRVRARGFLNIVEMRSRFGWCGARQVVSACEYFPRCSLSGARCARSMTTAGAVLTLRSTSRVGLKS